MFIALTGTGLAERCFTAADVESGLILCVIAMMPGRPESLAGVCGMMRDSRR